jgi:nitrite reductase/ring-hydroxylating ferredoxin subunit
LPSLTRRSLLALGCGAVCSRVLPGCGNPEGGNLPPIIPAGAAADVAPGSLRVVDGTSAAVGRDSAGIYALSLVCTHQRCDIADSGSVSAAGIRCSCHGATFDVTGRVTGGPARSTLAHLAVTVDASGALTVHGEEVVPAATRLVV